MIGEYACILVGRDAGFLFGLRSVFLKVTQKASNYRCWVKDLSATRLKKRVNLTITMDWIGVIIEIKSFIIENQQYIIKTPYHASTNRRLY